jgi:MFS family permease
MSPAETGRPSNKPAVRKLAFAGFISYVGTGAGEIALSVEVYRQTNSVVWLSLTFLLTFGLDGLFRPLAGAIADRFDRQRVMIVSSTLAGILWGLMAIADDPALLLGLGFLARVVWGPFGISAMAALPNMVSSDDLTWGNALFKTTGSSAQVTGYALGGLLVSVIGTGPVMLLNAASFILGSIIIASVRATFRAPHEEEEEDGRTGIFAGFPYIFRDPALRSLFLVWTTLFLAIDIAVVAELPLADEFGWGEFGFGIINAAWPLGAIAGAVAARRLTRRTEPYGVLIGTLAVTVGWGLVAVAPVFLLVPVAYFITAACDSLDDVGGFSIMQRRTSDAIRGRVLGAMLTAGMLANAVGFSFAGFLIEAFGPRGVFVLGAGLALLASPLLLPLFREVGRERDVSESPAGGES